MAQTADIDVQVNNNSGEDFAVVPEGIYTLEFVNFEDAPANANKFGPSIRLIYKILEGEYADQEIDELASLRGGIKAKLRQRAETLRGAPYSEDETIRLVPLYGKRAQAMVKVERDGQGEPIRNKIESMVAMPAPHSATAPPPAGRPAAKRAF